MSEDSQILIPPSFIALYVPEGRSRPSLPRDELAQRHELCEDMAQLLTEQAAQLQFKLGVHESDVLERMHAGLSSDESCLSPAEAGWVVKRLAELLDWSWPSWLEA